MPENAHLTDTIAVLMIVSFTIEAVVAGLLSILLVTPVVPGVNGDQKTALAKADRRRRALHFTLTLVLALIVCFLGPIGMFKALGLKNLNVDLDYFLTGLLLVAGADRIAALKKKLGSSAENGPPADSRSINITGKLTLDETASKGPDK